MRHTFCKPREFSLNRAFDRFQFNRISETVLKYSIGFRNLLAAEEAQDLVEYALVLALIAFGTTTAMKSLSSEINTAFSTISHNLATSL
jgi:pilus assembly protein Flp/PilA